MTRDFYQHEATRLMIVGEIKALGVRKWIRRYCILFNETRKEAVAVIRKAMV